MTYRDFVRLMGYGSVFIGLLMAGMDAWAAACVASGLSLLTAPGVQS